MWSNKSVPSSDHTERGTEPSTGEDQRGTRDDQRSTRDDQRGTRDDQRGTRDDQRGTRDDQRGTRGRSPYTVYLGNLAYECDEEDIREFFMKRHVKVYSCIMQTIAS